MRFYLYLISFSLIISCTRGFVNICESNNELKNEISTFYDARRKHQISKSDQIWLGLQSKDSVVISELIEKHEQYSGNSWIWFNRNENFFLSEICDSRRNVVFTICLLYHGNPDFYQCPPKWECTDVFNENQDFEMIWNDLQTWNNEMKEYGLKKLREQNIDPLFYSKCRFVICDKDPSFDTD